MHRKKLLCCTLILLNHPPLCTLPLKGHHAPHPHPFSIHLKLCLWHHSEASHRNCPKLNHPPSYLPGNDPPPVLRQTQPCPFFPKLLTPCSQPSPLPSPLCCSQAVQIHPCSVAFGTTRFESPWLIYSEKVATSAVYLRDVTMVTAYPILLFGGPLQVCAAVDPSAMGRTAKSVTAPGHTDAWFPGTLSKLDGRLLTSWWS